MTEEEREGIITRLNMVGCVLPLKTFSDKQLEEQYEHYKKWTDSVGTFSRYVGLEETGEFLNVTAEPEKFGGNGFQVTTRDKNGI